MLDIKFIRENPEEVRKAIRDKFSDLNIQKQQLNLLRNLLEYYDRKNELQIEVDGLRAQGKKAAEERNIHEGRNIKEKIKKLEKELKTAKGQFEKLQLETPPNLPKKDVVIGSGDTKNKAIKIYGKPNKFSFTPKDHVMLGEELDIFDIKGAAEISGTRFAYLKNDAVLLEFAIVQYALDVLLKEGFIPIIPPALIKQEITPGLGYWQAGGNGDYYLVFDPICRKCGVNLGSTELVKTIGREEFEKKLNALHIAEASIKHFQVTNFIMHPQFVEDVKNCLNCGVDLTSSVYLYLVGTAEHSIVPIHKDEILSKKDLPKRYVGFSSAFRREAGSYGKDTRGIFRVHQFDKVEMVSFVTEEDDDKEHEYLLSLEEKLWQALGIPYQVVKMCTGDLGFPVARKYDLEAWIPSQNKYREVTSVSTTTDFQARRLNIKYQDGDKKKFVHILNGTAFAIGRTIVAILENYQKEDGSVEIPEVLQKYMGKNVIKKQK